MSTPPITSLPVFDRIDKDFLYLALGCSICSQLGPVCRPDHSLHTRNAHTRLRWGLDHLSRPKKKNNNSAILENPSLKLSPKNRTSSSFLRYGLFFLRWVDKKANIKKNRKIKIKTFWRLFANRVFSQSKSLPNFLYCSFLDFFFSHFLG